MFLSGKTRGTSISAIIVSIIGTVVGVVVFFAVVSDAFKDAFNNSDSNQDWDVTLGAPREAWAEIANENQFNDPPEAGMEYWVVPITAKYKGDDTGNTAFDISVKFVGSDNRTYDRCGVIPTVQR